MILWSLSYLDFGVILYFYRAVYVQDKGANSIYILEKREPQNIASDRMRSTEGRAWSDQEDKETEYGTKSAPI